MTADEKNNTYNTVCFYCGTGCGIKLETCDNSISAAYGNPENPSNKGALCSKGKKLHKTVESPERLLYPMMRDAGKDQLARSSWEQALEYGTSEFARIIKEYGADSVGFYLSGQLPTEDYYVFNKLMKGFIGSNNLDSNSRLCMSSAVVAYKRAFGVDAPPTCYEDIDIADNVFIIGANPAYAHPIIFRRLERAKQANPNMQIVVIDPRKTASCSIADLHIQINPGTDVILFQAMLNIIIRENLTDKSFVASHTNGFDEVSQTVKHVTLKKAAEICGVEPSIILEAAYIFCEGKTLSMWTMGLNQSTSGSDKNSALLNLHLATGQISRPGCGPFSLTGQANAMGGREVGGLSNLLSAHRDLGKKEDRDEISYIWGADKIQEKPGLAATEMFEALENGKLRAIWIVCTNPLVSLPNTSFVEKALRKAELVIVSDVYHPTDTTRFAHVLLPAAGWAEKDGTATNCERRVSYLERALSPPGECLPDWQIARDFAVRLGKHLGKDWSEPFNYPDTESIFNEHRLTTKGRDCDITGLSYSLLRKHGPQHWPYPKNAEEGTKRLYQDKRFETPDGKARFFNVKYTPTAESLDAAYPLSLTTGRLRDQWHTMTKTGRVPELTRHSPFPVISINPRDASQRGLNDGDLAEIVSRHGKTKFPVHITDDVKFGVLFLPMHWGRMTVSGGGANVLVPSMVDPTSKEPEFKHIAVNVKKWEPKWRGTVIFPSQDGKTGRDIIDKFPYGITLSVESEKVITWVEIASDEKLLKQELDTIDKTLNIPTELESTVYTDSSRSIFKKAWISGGRLVAVRLIGKKTEDSEWLRDLILTGSRVEDFRQDLLFPANKKLKRLDKGRIVCSCMNVGEKDIRRAVSEGAKTVSDIKNQLGAGKSCGVCIQEIKAILDS